jgi:hypothetical protein
MQTFTTEVDMIEFTLEGLNARQRVLADIMWSLEEYNDVERFIKSLPKKEAAECRSIIEMMKMAIVEQIAPTLKEEESYPEAEQVLRKYNTKRG